MMIAVLIGTIVAAFVAGFATHVLRRSQPKVKLDEVEFPDLSWTLED